MVRPPPPASAALRTQGLGGCVWDRKTCPEDPAGEHCQDSICSTARFGLTSTPGSGGSGGCGSDRFRYARCQEVRTAISSAGHPRLQDGRRHGSLTIMRPLRAIIAAFGNFSRSHAAMNHASHARAPTRDGPARRVRGQRTEARASERELPLASSSRA